MLTRLRVHLVYAIGGVANSFALFLLIPYLVLRLTIEDYGTWNFFEVMILFVTMITGAGLDVGMIRAFWGENAVPPRVLIGTVIIGIMVWGILLLSLAAGIIVALIQLPRVTEVLPTTFNVYTLLLVVSIGVVEGWFNLLIAVLRVREQALSYVCVAFGRMLMFLVFVVVGVESGGGLIGVLNGRGLAAIIGVGIILLLLLPHFDWKWYQPIWNRVVRYGLPLLPTNIAMYMLLASDRYILTAFTSTQIVGIYGFMYKMATTLDIVIIRPFSLDWAQRRFAISKRPDAKEAFGQVALLFLWVSLTFGLLVFASTRLIYSWVANPDYIQGMPYIPLILLGFVAYGLSYPLNIGMILKDKTEWLPPLSWISAIVCLLLNLWWIPVFGMAGAAWSTLVAYGIFTLTLAIASQRLYPIHYPWWAIIKVGIIAFMAGAGIYGVELFLPSSIMLGTVMKVVWVMLLMLGIGYFLFGQYLPVKQPAYAMENAKG